MIRDQWSRIRVCTLRTAHSPQTIARSLYNVPGCGFLTRFFGALLSNKNLMPQDKTTSVYSVDDTTPLGHIK